MRPGQSINLKGYGREPIGIDGPARYDNIIGPAITHRWDLIEADPAKPYIPKVVEGNGLPNGYVPVDPSIATIDPMTGKVSSGRTNHPVVYGLAVLSVGEQVETWPLAFLPKRSFTTPPPPRFSVPVVPEIRVLGFNASSLAPPTTPPPPSPTAPINTTLNLPAPPGLPSFPAAGPLSIPPPAPPAPPAPPGASTGTGLSLSINIAGVMVPPTTGVAAQPTPPVNPSPPGGARKEAKQHQASAAKSEEGAKDATQGAGGDLANQPDSMRGDHAMTRRDRIRTEGASFSVVGHEQASAWVTGLQWGGGIGLMALILALGFTTVRPTPRGRRRAGPDVQAAPAWNPHRYRR
jgi:hypothetical protein